MTDDTARGWRPSELGRSPLIDDMEPRDSRVLEFLKLLGTTVVGLVAGGLAAVVVMVVVLLALVIGSSGDTEAITQLMTVLESSEPPSSLSLTIILLTVLAGINTLFAVVFVLISSLLRKRRFFANITAARRFRWGHLVVGMALNALALGGLLAFEAIFGGQELAWPVLALTDNAAEIALMVGAVTAAFIVAAFAEEILFRGWLLRETAVFTRQAVILLLINGVLFSAIHLTPQSWPPDPNALIARTVMGMAFCYMALRFGGIEFATGAHAANNIMLTLIVEPLALVEPPAEPIRAGLMVESVVLMAIGVLITELAARAPFLRGLMGPPATAPTERYATFD